MAATHVTISGIQFTGKSMKGEPFNFVGYMGNPDVQVGGGPIIVPKPPDVFPDPPPEGEIKPPPDSGGWGYHEDYGWFYVPGPGGAGPK